jgi:transposase
MTSAKYIGMDVHKESISIAVMNSVGKVVMECVIETKASVILQFLNGLSRDLHVTFEEGTAAAWLYDLLKPHVTRLIVCNPRRNALMKVGNKSDRIDARKLAELLRGKQLQSVYHGEHGRSAMQARRPDKSHGHVQSRALAEKTSKLAVAGGHWQSLQLFLRDFEQLATAEGGERNAVPAYQR